MRLARIAELLRWSAPVYLLDVAEARTVAHGLMPVISCELPRQADADAIDGALAHAARPTGAARRRAT
ncbi:hypothetical protein ACU4HD_37660 [Cupriavidus basilensis]